MVIVIVSVQYSFKFDALRIEEFSLKLCHHIIKHVKMISFAAADIKQSKIVLTQTNPKTEQTRKTMHNYNN